MLRSNEGPTSFVPSPKCGKMSGPAHDADNDREPNLSSLLTHLLAQAAAPRLVGSKLSHVSQPTDTFVVLSLYGPDRETRHLGFSLRLATPLFFLVDARPASRPKPTNFLMSLRKHLEFARLTAIERSKGERVVRFAWETPQGPHSLYYEGLAKYPNLILTGPDGCILSAVRYLNDGERPVLPQSPYAPPPQAKDKPSLWDLDGPALEALAASVPVDQRALWLKTAFRGSDIETTRHLLASALPLGETWDELVTRLEKNAWRPLFVKEGPPPALRLYPSEKEEDDVQRFDDPLEAAARFQSLLESNETFLSIRRRLEQEVRSALKREKRILEKLKGDRAEAEKADQYQWWGELVMAQLHTLPSHSREVVLEDIVRGTGSTLHIPLDPGMSPLLNAQRFFRKSQKGSRGLSMVEERERQVQGRIEELKAAERSLPALHQATEVQAAWTALFPVKAVLKAAPKAKVERVPTPNVLRRKLNKDWELVAGTSAAANEYVTFQLAQPEDLWFHVRDFPGSHVLLRKLRREAVAPDAVLLEAALLAAERSKAPTGSKVTVSFTEKKYVKRIPGMSVGVVSYSKEQSIIVEAPSSIIPPKP
jgi:predicted ribosome quality control (RQC) complex YloA/Tae2 family protein